MPTGADTTFGVAASVLMIVLMVPLVVSIARMKRLDWEDRQASRRWLRRMLYADGAWIASVGLLLVAWGNSPAAIGPIGVGLLLIFGARYGLLTGEWVERLDARSVEGAHRSQDHDDDDEGDRPPGNVHR